MVFIVTLDRRPVGNCLPGLRLPSRAGGVPIFIPAVGGGTSARWKNAGDRLVAIQRNRDILGDENENEYT